MCRLESVKSTVPFKEGSIFSSEYYTSVQNHDL